MKKICILSAVNIKHMSLISIYTKYFKENGMDYDVIYMDKYNEAKGREHNTMIRARQIALNLNLNMKIGDVEYQGDGIVLYAERVEPCEKLEEEMVYFN